MGTNVGLDETRNIYGKYLYDSFSNFVDIITTITVQINYECHWIYKKVLLFCIFSKYRYVKYNFHHMEVLEASFLRLRGALILK